MRHPPCRFRLLVPAALVALGGCHPAAAPFVAAGAADAGTIAVFGRSSVDIAYSAVSGRDCSVVRLDRGESYCRPKEAAPPPQPACTRTLGTPECFADPAALLDHPAFLADGPAFPVAPAAAKPARMKPAAVR